MFRLMPYGKIQNDFLKRRDVFDTFFDDFVDDMMAPISKFEGQFKSFKVDVVDQGNQYLIEADLPGFNKEDVGIEYNNNYLTITATSQKKSREEADKVIRQERFYGEFKRSFYVENVQPEGIEAKFENGVLRITLQKTEDKPSKRSIEIKG